jgi:hypothetical protein
MDSCQRQCIAALLCSLASIAAHILYSSSPDVIVHLVTEGFEEPHFAPFLLTAVLFNKQVPSVAGSTCGALPARASNAPGGALDNASALPRVSCGPIYR